MNDATEFDAVLDVCRHNHRRIALAALADRQQVTRSDLARTIVEHDHYTPRTDADEAVTRIRNALHHVHLPKLEASGFVEYDPARQLVEPTAQFRRGAASLSAILDADPAISTPIDA